MTGKKEANNGASDRLIAKQNPSVNDSNECPTDLEFVIHGVQWWGHWTRQRRLRASLKTTSRPPGLWLV